MAETDKRTTLERLAKEARFNGPWYSADELHREAGFPLPTARLFAACSPDVILALLAAARQGEETERMKIAAHSASVTLDEVSDVLAEQSEDTADMDWLAQQVVNVRTPTPYGSLDLFWSSPGDDDEPSDLRARVRAARAASQPEEVSRGE